MVRSLCSFDYAALCRLILPSNQTKGNMSLGQCSVPYGFRLTGIVLDLHGTAWTTDVPDEWLPAELTIGPEFGGPSHVKAHHATESLIGRGAAPRATYTLGPFRGRFRDREIDFTSFGRPPQPGNHSFVAFVPLYLVPDRPQSALFQIDYSQWLSVMIEPA